MIILLRYIPWNVLYSTLYLRRKSWVWINARSSIDCPVSVRYRHWSNSRLVTVIRLWAIFFVVACRCVFSLFLNHFSTPLYFAIDPTLLHCFLFVLQALYFVFCTRLRSLWDHGKPCRYIDCCVRLLWYGTYVLSLIMWEGPTRSFETSNCYFKVYITTLELSLAATALIGYQF